MAILASTIETKSSLENKAVLDYACHMYKKGIHQNVNEKYSLFFNFNKLHDPLDDFTRVWRCMGAKKNIS